MRLAFALEYSLGHITHAENLKAALASERSIEPLYTDIPYDNTPLPGMWRKMPGLFGNWSLRASLVAYHAMKNIRPRPNAAFFHTQVTSLLSAGLMAKVPSIVSLDATPLQYDSLGAFYRHKSGSAQVELLKKRLNQRALSSAQRLITWSEWAKRSLIDDYGMPAEKIEVIPPGIDLDRWHFERTAKADDPIRLLFVGGDFQRKGGDTLLESFRSVRNNLPDAELHVVTKSASAGEGQSGVIVHRGLTPNSAELMRLYAEADLFVFPTRGDCLPLAVMEALAAGLPVITTDVGALSEASPDGETGLVIPVDDAQALEAAIKKLSQDGPLRQRMARAAREKACERFDAKKNYKKIIAAMQEIAS
jgi:glycosyltransferase involved in cell wall biosynthesis